MKKIWYLKRKDGQGTKAVKLFLYEKDGHAAAKMDLSAFDKEIRNNSSNLFIEIKGIDKAEVGVIDLSGRDLLQEAYLQGKGQLQAELVEKIRSAKGELQLAVTIGDIRYLSENWQETLAEKSLTTDAAFKNEEARADEVRTDEVRTDEVRTDEVREEELRAEELQLDQLPAEEESGKRIVQLSVLEDEMVFREYLHNSFLLHGYYNYGHVIIDETKAAARLGVPGNYYEREQMVATMFGFPDFEPARQEEKIQNGTFGYYYTKAKCEER